MTSINLDDMYEKVAVSLVEARVRVRTLLELLEEKKVFLPGDFDDKAQKLWESDFDEIYEDLTTPNPEPEPADALPAAQPMTAQDYATGMIQNLIDEAIGSRIRVRAIIGVLEEKGIFAPGEFDTRSEEIWNRDFEEMTLDYYKKFS